MFAFDSDVAFLSICRSFESLLNLPLSAFRSLIYLPCSLSLALALCCRPLSFAFWLACQYIFSLPVLDRVLHSSSSLSLSLSSATSTPFHICHLHSCPFALTFFFNLLLANAQFDRFFSHYILSFLITFFAHRLPSARQN
jgi:hypothetical protein